MARGPDYHASAPRGKKPVLAVLAVALALLAGSVVLFPYLVDDEAPDASNPRGSPPDAEDVRPTAKFEVACENLACTFDATDSEDPDGSIVRYQWDFGDGNTAQGSVADHTYAEAGTYTVSLTVADDDGNTDVERDDVDVEAAAPPPPPATNQPPQASFTYSCENGTCRFDGTGSRDTDGAVVAYDWDFGDGNMSTGAVVTHAYAAPGVYTVTLTVTDDKGATNAREWKVLV